MVKKNRSPVSRILFPGPFGPGPLPFIWLLPSPEESALPTPPARAKGATARAVQLQGVRGISTREVYPTAGCPARTCALTARFHPYSALGGAVIFCDTFCRFGVGRNAHPLGGAALCVVRTFLPLRRQSGLRLSFRSCCQVWH
jgi:hypothetical protein